MKSLLVVTTCGPLPLPFAGRPESAFRVHFPALESETRAACLLTGLYPGRVISAGEKGASRRTFLDALRTTGIAVFARAPAGFSFLIPEGTAAPDLERLASEATPFVAWIHAAEALPPVALGPQTAIVAVDLGDPAAGNGAWLEHAFWGTGYSSVPLKGITEASVLDLLPTLRETLGLSIPLGDGMDLSWGEQGHDRPFFTEDWRFGLFSVSHGGRTLVCRAGGHRLPWFLSTALWRLGVWRTRRSGARTIWDATPRVETASRLTPVPVALESDDPPADRDERRRLAGLLEAHLASYGQNEEVLGRLQDLGYL